MLYQVLLHSVSLIDTKTEKIYPISEVLLQFDDQTNDLVGYFYTIPQNYAPKPTTLLPHTFRLERRFPNGNLTFPSCELTGEPNNHFRVHNIGQFTSILFNRPRLDWKP